MSARRVVSVAVFLGALVCAGHAPAVTTYIADAQANSPGGGPCLGSNGGVQSSVPTSASVTCTDPTGFGTGTVAANTGILGVSGEAVIDSPFSFFAAGGGGASFEDTNVVFSIADPSLFLSQQATVGVFMAIHGVLQSAGFAEATASFVELLNGQTAVSYSINESEGLVTCNGIVGPGSPCAAVVSGTLASAPLVVPIGVPVSFFMSLSTRAHSIGPGSASATADWGQTMEFPLSGPVFDLPPGVTVNAPDSFIFDNRFIPPDAVSPVDEPPAALLMASGLGVLAMLLRRRRRR